MMGRWFTIALVLTSSHAWAGRKDFAWLYDTEINPERNVEVETWIQEENRKGDHDVNETLIWWAPTIGVTQHLELAIPIEFAFSDDRMGIAGTNLERWGGELRYRFNSPDPVAAGPLTFLLRGAVKRAVDDRGGVRAEADVVVGYDGGPVRVLADVGTVVNAGKDPTEAELRPALGVSVKVTDELRLGAEAYSELVVAADEVSWLAVGPDVSWTHGRFWVVAGYPIGVFGIKDAPRVSFGIAF
jgi:hypothetical protein